MESTAKIEVAFQLGQCRGVVKKAEDLRLELRYGIRNGKDIRPTRLTWNSLFAQRILETFVPSFVQARP